MKNLLVSFVLALCAISSNAAPATPQQKGYIAHMVGECSSVMGREVCTVLIDANRCKGSQDENACQLAQFRDKYPRGLQVAGAGSFTADEYFMYAKEGDRMCDVIVRQCAADYDGRGCLMGRALWRQQ